MRVQSSSLAGIVLSVTLACPDRSAAEPVPVRVAENPASHALALRSLDGQLLANGHQRQTVSDGQVTSHVVFHFADGSVHDETTVFSQQDVLRLVNYRLRQNGPSFRWTLEMTLDTRTGRAVVRYREGNGRERLADEVLELPADVGNGMMVPVLKNLSVAPMPAMASFVAATPRPRLVKLAIPDATPESLSGDGPARRTRHFVVKVEIGGLPGLLAPLVGKQPPDTHVWILEGPAPAFLKSEGPLFYEGPIWRIEAVP